MDKLKNINQNILLCACFALSACSASNDEPATTAIPELTGAPNVADTPITQEDTGSEQVAEPAPEQSNNTESLGPPLCLSHPNGIVYCVDHNNRRFSATQSDNAEWWAFTLPGDNNRNAVIAILAVEDKVAIIADKTPDAEQAEKEFENNRFEVSLFEPHGDFIDTRQLLKVPSENAFVAICSNESTDNCIQSLATHQFTKYDSWQYEHALPLIETYSTKAINANNFDTLIRDLPDFWGTDHFGYIGAELSKFKSAVKDQLVVSLDITQDDIPADWLRKYSDRTDLYTLKLCPDGGSIILFEHNPRATLFKNCNYLDWTVNGEISSKAAHRTSDFRYKNIHVTSTDAEHAMNGGYSFTGGGLYGSNSFSTSYLLSSTTERRTEVKGLSFGSSYGSDSRGSNDGWRVVLADGRTGTFIDKGHYFSKSSVGFWLKDSVFSNIPINVSARRETSVIRESIRLSDGSYVPANEEITYTLIDPGDGRREQTSTFHDIVSPPYFTSGTTTFTAEDGSALIITPYFEHHTPLAKVNLYGADHESPQVTTYMDYRRPSE